jgi:hypothetical protein
VDRQHGRRARSLRMGEQSRGKTKMPVMHMDNVRLPRCVRAKSEPRGHMREDAEANRIVWPVAPFPVLVQACTPIQCGAINEEHRQIAVRCAPGDEIDSADNRQPCERHQPSLPNSAVQCGGVARHQHAHVHAKLGQRDRQCRRHVRQTAGLGEWDHFRARNQDAQYPADSTSRSRDRMLAIGDRRRCYHEDLLPSVRP